MTIAANLELLDQLGLVLCRLSGEAVSLSWSPEVGGFYAISIVDPESGGSFTGTGDSPTEALTLAVTKRDVRRATLTRMEEGFVCDA